MNFSLQSRLNRIQFAALMFGLLAFGLTCFGAVLNRKQFQFSYLFAWLFWLGLTLGCFMVTMIHQLTGGRWGYPTRRFLEAGFMNLPLMLLLFIPILLGLRFIYPWAQPNLVAQEPVLQLRQSYQNIWMFITRAVVFFLIAIWMTRRLRSLSLQQDLTPDATPTRKARTLSGPGVVIYALSGTFVYIDWILSLEKKWHSTMFPVIMLIGQILVAYAFSVVMLTFFKNHDPLAKAVNKTHYHHLGNLLLTFVLFWTYISFGQLLIIYSADIPQEIDWYLHRMAGSWKWIIAALALFHFFLPFFLLLFRTVKLHVVSLTTLAALLFMIHIVDAYWLVMPTLHQDGLAISWMDFTAPIGIGGLWLTLFLARLKSVALLPQQDPGMQFAFVYGH